MPRFFSDGDFWLFLTLISACSSVRLEGEGAGTEGEDDVRSEKERDALCDVSDALGKEERGGGD